ncbi:conserved oligomeric Golgi complex subunit 3 [Cephus cinctus]|uniref:Conserved oligomeric Golgi complex subunit 3 n=1 Tax=Cephus cinctus TaxID=211228 RepID=A0AAJ7CFN8_CEPCN|nr:conserved oligomeric Golgi complex subunit 3 [Cephus cinctus]
MAKSKSIPDNLIKWDVPEDPLAPLTDCQKEWLVSLQEEVSSLDVVTHECLPETLSQESDGNQTDVKRIETYQELLQCYTGLEERYMSAEDTKYVAYLEQLKSRRQECHDLCLKIENALVDFSTLSKQYTTVSSKTTSLHDASEQLISDQEKLNSFIDSISDHVKYFKEVDHIMEKLEAPTISVNSEIFFNLLNQLDTNMDFVQNNPTFKESNIYLVKYRHCQSKAITLMQHYIFNLLSNATKSILNPKETGNMKMENTDAALALFYGRFQTILPKVKLIIEQIETKSYKRQEYDSLLLECHQYYLTQRGLVLGPSVQKALQKVKEKYNGDHCSLVRHSCALLLHASIDEHRLFYQFFSKPSSGLTAYLEGLCTSLYDTLRPFIIHINHLETLAEICCILRIEMLDEHVQNNSEPLQGFGNICLQLLHDVQERLVFRAHLYLQSDILNYNPSAGDLAYPEKLKMMEDIAESLREESHQIRLKRISLSSSDNSTFEPISRSHITMDPINQKPHIGNSPADLHGMWYPTVRRTLVCLSRLYRCVDRPVFQSLSQEAISICVQSIESAKQKIQSRSTQLDAELFQVKHLLILREQIAPFQVDFTIKEYSLDFSKVKTAAFGLLEKRSRLFTLSNNALLEFLLEGAPQMKEQLIDSRKYVDAKLKYTCQRLIQNATYLLIEPLVKFLEEAKLYVNSDGTSSIRQKSFGNTQEIAAIVSEALRLIKFKLPGIQQSMQLYLANRETECILFRPIKNNIVAAFTQLSQLLSNNYNADELLLIGCPLPEQVSVMLSSTSLVQGKSVQSQKSNSDEEQVQTARQIENAFVSSKCTDNSDVEQRTDIARYLQSISGQTQNPSEEPQLEGSEIFSQNTGAHLHNTSNSDNVKP